MVSVIWQACGLCKSILRCIFRQIFSIIFTLIYISNEGIFAFLKRIIMTPSRLYMLFTFVPLYAISQNMTIISLARSKVKATVVSDSANQKLVQKFNGKQDNTMRKQWTARTFRLSNNQLLIEFYDEQALLINNFTDFEKLEKIRFVKTNIDFLKKNIS